MIPRTNIKKLLEQRRKKEAVIGYERVLGYNKAIGAHDFEQILGGNVVLQCANSALSTPRGKRIRDCSFGSELYKYVYEPADEQTVAAIRQEIVRTLEEQDERIHVDRIDVEFFRHAHGFKVRVFFSLPSGEQYETSATVTPETIAIL